MLNTIELHEVYKVQDKKVYAIIKETGSKRQVDPCEVRIELTKENEVLLQKKQALEKELSETTNKLVENTRLDNQIAALGYCRIDKPVYKKIDGITMRDSNGNPLIDKYTHQSDCPSRGC